MLGYTARWVLTVIPRWNSEREEGIQDHRHEIDVSQPLLSAEQQQELAKALQDPPEDGGLWSGPKVAQWMQRPFGCEIAPQRGWDSLQRVGDSSRVPRPQYAKADQEVHQALKKTARAG